MQEGAVRREDPRARARVSLVAVASLLLLASGVFAPSIALHADGTHGAAVDPQPIRLLVFLVVSALAIAMARNPERPDVRVAKSLMLAAAVIALVVGLADLLTANGMADQAAGAAPYLQLAAAALFLIARWARTLWPATLWDLGAPGGTGAGSRRGR